MIKLIVFDIDGVITDGTIIIDSRGNEQKQIDLKDVDSIFELKHKGYKIAAITGENTEIVNYFEKRFPWDYFYRGVKEKKKLLKEIEEKAEVDRREICYVGDGKYDVEPIIYAGLGVCPANATNAAKRAADIILRSSGGRGCLWELLTLLEKYGYSDYSRNYFFKRLDEHINIFKKLASDYKLISIIMEIGDLIVNTLKNDGGIYLCGNGGSAADAQHIATEFISRFYKDRPAMNAEALTVNTCTLTAIGNDYGYEQVFARQLEAKARPGDILIGISTSGCSRNVWEALRYAKKNGIRTVLLTGDQDVSEINESCEYVVKVPSKVTPRIQEAHIFIGHTIAEYVEHSLFL